MHISFIFILFCLFSSGQAYYNSHDSDETRDKHSFLTSRKTTKFSIFDETTKEVDIYDDDEDMESMETTTQMKKTTKHHDYSNHEGEGYYDDHEDETEDEKVSSTTTLLSSSSKTRLSTSVITETTTSKSEIPLTSSILPASSSLYHIFMRTLSTTTIDPKEIAAFLTKTNRDRLFLKIFVITAVIGMVILSIALITIHQVRKARRYGGYGKPTTASSNEQSKDLNNIRI